MALEGNIACYLCEQTWQRLKARVYLTPLIASYWVAKPTILCVGVQASGNYIQHVLQLSYCLVSIFTITKLHTTEQIIWLTRVIVYTAGLLCVHKRNTINNTDHMSNAPSYSLGCNVNNGGNSRAVCDYLGFPFWMYVGAVFLPSRLSELKHRHETICAYKGIHPHTMQQLSETR